MNLKNKIRILLLVVAVNIFLFAGIPVKKMAQALVNSYAKVAGSPLTYYEWNKLLDDFVLYDGVTNNIDMNNFQITGLTDNPTTSGSVVSRGWIDSQVTAGASTINAVNGDKIKVFCAHAPYDASNWSVSLPTSLSLRIDTTNASFSNDPSKRPTYFVSITGPHLPGQLSIDNLYGGAGYDEHDRYYQVNSIFNSNYQGFSIFLDDQRRSANRWYQYRIAPSFDPNWEWQWSVNWCGYQRI